MYARPENGNKETSFQRQSPGKPIFVSFPNCKDKTFHSIFNFKKHLMQNAFLAYTIVCNQVVCTPKSLHFEVINNFHCTSRYQIAASVLVFCKLNFNATAAEEELKVIVHAFCL